MSYAKSHGRCQSSENPEGLTCWGALGHDGQHWAVVETTDHFKKIYWSEPINTKPSPLSMTRKNN